MSWDDNDSWLDDTADSFDSLHLDDFIYGDDNGHTSFDEMILGDIMRQEADVEDQNRQRDYYGEIYVEDDEGDEDDLDSSDDFDAVESKADYTYVSTVSPEIMHDRTTYQDSQPTLLIADGDNKKEKEKMKDKKALKKWGIYELFFFLFFTAFLIPAFSEESTVCMVFAMIFAALAILSSLYLEFRKWDIWK